MEILAAFLFVAQPLALGVWSQKVMGRTGIIWFCIALALDVAFAVFVDGAMTSNPRIYFDESYRRSLASAGTQFVEVVAPVVVSTIITAIVVLTLPRRAK